MKIDRIQPEYYQQGSSLTVKEMVEDGFAELELKLPKDGVLFQYKQQIQFVFQNRKRADGIVFYPDGKGTWAVLLVELKRTVNTGKWESIKLQWHGAWLHSIALAAVLDIKLSGRVDVMAGYREHVMDANMTDPILLKVRGSDFIANSEWRIGIVQLQDVGSVAFHRCQLNEQGLGEFFVV